MEKIFRKFPLEVVQSESQKKNSRRNHEIAYFKGQMNYFECKIQSPHATVSLASLYVDDSSSSEGVTSN